jgi:hypothetical protein
VRDWQRELQGDAINPDRRNILEYLISEIDADNVKVVQGIIDADIAQFGWINPAR